MPEYPKSIKKSDPDQYERETASFLDRVMAAVEADDNIGFCVKCKQEQYGVEPDARQYECESCGKKSVYGAQEILLTMVA